MSPRDKTRNSTAPAQSATEDSEGRGARSNRWGAAFDVLRYSIFSNSLYLSAHEQTLLLFIFSRTRMYGKEWETIPLRHFTEGVWSRNAGVVCSRLAMKVNTVIEARNHLSGKGIIEVREHSVQAYRYRVCEPDEIVPHDIITYLVRHQPKQLAALVRELRLNKKRLPPEFLQVLELAQAGTARNSLDSSSTSRDTEVLPGRIERASSRGIKPTNNPNVRLKSEKISNLVPGPGASAGKEFCPRPQKTQFRVLPKPQRDKAVEFQLALIEAARSKAAKRVQRLSKPNIKAWQRAWSDTMKLRYPTAASVFPDRVFRNLKSAVSEWGIPPEQVSPLIKWTIENWEFARRAIFSYSVHKPFGSPLPDAGLFISKLSKLHFVFAGLTNGTLARSGVGFVPVPLSAQPMQQSALSAPPPPIDHQKAEAVRKRLGLKPWKTA